MLYGNVDGIKKSILWQLEKLDTQYSKDVYVEEELLAHICSVTSLINREICVNLDFRGRLLSVGVGVSNCVTINHHSAKRSENNNTGIRSIHTHPNGVGLLSDVDFAALKQARLDSICAVGVKNGSFNGMQVALYSKKGENAIYTYRKYSEIDNKTLLLSTKDEITVKKNTLLKTDDEKGKAVLVYIGEDKQNEIDRALEELSTLAKTLEIETVGIVQQKGKPNTGYLIGEGKLKELSQEIQLKNANIVIFESELSAIQHKNITEALKGVKVINRSMLILDIFSKHAVSDEGKLQIRLAKQRYHLPLLIDVNADYDRQKGGIMALSGSGETKLESDRRQIKREIRDLTEKLALLQRKKQSRREVRKQNGIKTVSIVGYTNAGKSTLMNYLTKSDVLVENKLFATLDVTTRKIWTEKGEYLISDTVGFISRLPHEFIQAFISTLEEAKFSDLLLVVLDTTSKNMNKEYEVVQQVLNELSANSIPKIIVYNKVDKNIEFERVETECPSVDISALTGNGVDKLRALIERTLF